jgi:uncharacterized protein (DUF58 family)
LHAGGRGFKSPRVHGGGSVFKLILSKIFGDAMKNIGDVERLVRIFLGLTGIVFAVYLTTGVYAITLGVLGLLLVLTGLIGYCPIYALLKPKRKLEKVKGQKTKAKASVKTRQKRGRRKTKTKTRKTRGRKKKKD